MSNHSKQSSCPSFATNTINSQLYHFPHHIPRDDITPIFLAAYCKNEEQHQRSTPLFFPLTVYMSTNGPNRNFDISNIFHYCLKPYFIKYLLASIDLRGFFKFLLQSICGEIYIFGCKIYEYLYEICTCPLFSLLFILKLDSRLDWKQFSIYISVYSFPMAASNLDIVCKLTRCP